MTDTIRALLEKAEPDAWLTSEPYQGPCDAAARFLTMTQAWKQKLLLEGGDSAEVAKEHDSKLFTIDTVCAALSASAAVEPVDAGLLAAARFALTTPGMIKGRDTLEKAIQRAEPAQPKEAEKVCEGCRGVTNTGGPALYCAHCGGKIVEVKP